MKRLNKLITDVSNASRLDAELALQETEPVDVREVLHGIAGVFRDILGEDTRRIVLEIAEQSQYPSAYVVWGLEARLGRVITNLIDNAISFSPENGVITVHARRVGPEIEIVVEDDGPGIPDDDLERIFDRFYTERPAEHGFGKNSGLGLAIARQIVASHGGRIWAENRADVQGARIGARFTVELPLARSRP